LENQDVTSTPSDRCTTGCTNKQENVNAGPSVEDLAAALKGLSAEDRQRLTALLGTGSAPIGAPGGAGACNPSLNFNQRFDAAFTRLDRDQGGHNFVSLIAIRKALADVSRDTFDAGLQALRLAGRFTLSAAEGRHGLTVEERNAGIVEDGTLLLYVSKRQI
jgi:hypothetical protein